MNATNVFLLVIVIAMALVAIVLITRDAAGSKSAMNWRTDYAQAVAESAKTGKPLLMDFTASWCPPCRQMKQDVWTDSKVAAAANASFIPVLVDVDANPAVAQQYGVHAIPSLIIQWDDTITYNQAGYHPADAVLQVMAAHKRSLPFH